MRMIGKRALKAAQNGFPSGPDLYPIQTTCQHVEKKTVS